MLEVNGLIGQCDVLLITLDTLRYDVAERSLREGRTPNLARWLPHGGWEKRHSPGNFTYAAHQAFFAGFLPTRAAPGPHPRLFALRFPGSETIAAETCVFDAPNIVAGLAERGYHTLCIGGVGFFNKQSPLGGVLPGLFAESYWSEDLGVTSPCSTENQVATALSALRATSAHAAGVPVPEHLRPAPAQLHLSSWGERRLARDASGRLDLCRPPLAAFDGRAVPARAGARDCLLRPWHGLWRGRLPRSPAFASGGLGCARRRVPVAEARAAATMKGLAELLDGSPLVAYTYSYPHKTAHWPLVRPVASARSVGCRRPPTVVSLLARALLRATLCVL